MTVKEKNKRHRVSVSNTCMLIEYIGPLHPSCPIAACALWVFRGGRTHCMVVNAIAVCLLLAGAVHAIGCVRQHRCILLSCDPCSNIWDLLSPV